MLEPGLIEEVQRILILVTFSIDELERARQHEAVALLDTAGEMEVDVDIAVYVIKPSAVRVVNIDGQLPCAAPVGQIFSGQGISGALYLKYDGPGRFAPLRLGEIEVSIRGMINLRLNRLAAPGTRM